MKSQSPPMTFTGMMRTLNAMPATPTPLFVSWPIVPATCVPWPSRSSGVVVVPDEIARRDEPIRRRRGRAPPRTARRSGRAPERSGRRGQAERARVVAHHAAAVGHAAVEHGDRRPTSVAPGIDVPRALHVERRVVPLARVERIVRHELRIHPVARLRVLDVGLRVEPPRRRFGVCGGGRSTTMSKLAYGSALGDRPVHLRRASRAARPATCPAGTSR